VTCLLVCGVEEVLVRLLLVIVAESPALELDDLLVVGGTESIFLVRRRALLGVALVPDAAPAKVRVEGIARLRLGATG